MKTYSIAEGQALLAGESTKELDAQAGEQLAEMSRAYGKIAAGLLFRSQWGYGESEWYDHRLHLLDPEFHFTDFWTASADNVIRVLPFGGRLLDLCSGDGFYDYWFYAQRAEVTAVEYLPEVHEFAKRHHAKPNIQYILCDVREFEPATSYFDVVLIRGAIEHFTEDDQQRLFRKAFTALRPGGYFCGDTPRGNPEAKMLNAHEHEWHSEFEMRQALSGTFSDIDTWTLQSKARTTLFWRCRK